MTTQDRNKKMSEQDGTSLDRHILAKSDSEYPCYSKAYFCLSSRIWNFLRILLRLLKKEDPAAFNLFHGRLIEKMEKRI